MGSNSGYKRSEFGPIPAEWEIKNVSDVADVKGGFAFDSKKFTKAGKYQVIKMSNLYENVLDLTRSRSFLEKITKEESDSLLRNGDIIITLTGTVGKRDYGYSYQIQDERNLLLNQRIARIVGTKANGKYLYYEIKTKRFLNQFFYSSRGGTGNQANVGTTDLSAIRVVLPTPPEQTKIAQILSCWDLCIEQQQRLLKAKREQQKGLMQQLLTGKRRFKEFAGRDWKEVQLGEIFTEITDTNDGRNSHSIMTISSRLGLVSQEDKFDRIIAGNSLMKYTQIKCGDFAYNKGNSKSYQMGCVYQLEDREGALVPFVYICFRPTGAICSTFYKYWFLAHGLDRQLRKIITSGARGDGLLNVSTQDFFKLKVPLPPKGEQKAVAHVFEALSKEILFLETQLGALKWQKRGLMHKLLTGQLRVTIGEENKGQLVSA